MDISPYVILPHDDREYARLSSCTLLTGLLASNQLSLPVRHRLYAYLVRDMLTWRPLISGRVPTTFLALAFNYRAPDVEAEQNTTSPLSITSVWILPSYPNADNSILATSVYFPTARETIRMQTSGAGSMKSKPLRGN